MFIPACSKICNYIGILLFCCKIVTNEINKSTILLFLIPFLIVSKQKGNFERQPNSEIFKCLQVNQTNILHSIENKAIWHKSILL